MTYVFQALIMSNQAQWVAPPDSHYFKHFGGWHGFMRSYGLKPHDDDDVYEAKQILQGMKDGDKFAWEEEQKEKAAAAAAARK